MIRRTVLEWQRITYGERKNEIPTWAADRLVAVARSSLLGGEGGTRILTHGRHDLRAGQVVGVVAGEGCVLEILPKIERLGDGADDLSRRRIRRQLVHMLAIALDVDIVDGRIVELGWQRENLLEILIGLFAHKLADAVRFGLPHRYVGCKGDLLMLRGRLDVTRQFTTLAATPQRLACRYDAFLPDIALNRIMTAAIARLARLSRSAENQRILLHELAFAYAGVAGTAVPALRWDEVILDRTNRRWSELLNLAKLLLGERFQTTTCGEAQGFSLLFEMNTLFEEYVARMLRPSLARDEFTVERQGGRLYCLEELDGERRPRFQTVPDILVKRGSKTLVLIDTKWKQLSARIVDPKQEISQSNVYQTIAYSRLYRCSRLMLLYPYHAGLGDTDGIMARYRISGSIDELAIATIDVGTAKGIAERLGALVRALLCTACSPSSSRLGRLTAIQPS